MKSRLNLPVPGKLTAEQQIVYDDIWRTRGNMNGPFLAWLLTPALGQPAQQLGAVCRYGTSLSLQESELLILKVAGHFHSVGEQQIHEPIAIKSGLDRLICGNCRHRGHEVDGRFGVERTCYVNEGQAPLGIWKAWKAGRYPALRSLEVFTGRKVRFGAYGDPTHLPISLALAIAGAASATDIAPASMSMTTSNR